MKNSNYEINNSIEQIFSKLGTCLDHFAKVWLGMYHLTNIIVNCIKSYQSKNSKVL